MKDLITKAQLAAELNVSTQTISKWVLKGILPKPVRLGVRVYWNRDEIQKAIDRAAEIAQ